MPPKKAKTVDKPRPLAPYRFGIIGNFINGVVIDTRWLYSKDEAASRIRSYGGSCSSSGGYYSGFPMPTNNCQFIFYSDSVSEERLNKYKTKWPKATFITIAMLNSMIINGAESVLLSPEELAIKRENDEKKRAELQKIEDKRKKDYETAKVKAELKRKEHERLVASALRLGLLYDKDNNLAVSQTPFAFPEDELDHFYINISEVS